MPDSNLLADAAALPGMGVADPQSAPVSDADLASILGYSPSQNPTAGPVTSPSQDLGTSSYSPGLTPAQPQPVGVGPQSTSSAMGAKVGVQGYNPNAMAAIQKGPGSTVEKKMAADRAEVGQQFAPIQQEEHQAADTAISAITQQGQIESQKAVVAAEAHRKISAANRDFMVKEQAASDNARAESTSNFANYKAALLDYNASQINPSQLWDNAGTGGQFGMVATAFIHDFLGAKGIKTTGLESLNKAIQYNISGQLDNMRKKLDVANGFKTLWEMQRQQSATDAEARARMNGFYLAAVQNQIDAQLGSYDSQLALVKAQAAKAGIQQEMAKNDLLVQKHIDDAANQRATNRVHLYAAELTAASSKYTADAHVKAAQLTAAAKDKLVSPLAGVIFDTSKSGGGMAARRLLPDIKDEKGEKREQAAKVFNTVGNIEKLIDLQDQIAKVPPDIGIDALKRMQSEERRVAELVRNTTKMGIIYDNSGKQINEQEVKLYDEIVSKKDWFLNGDNIRTLGTLAKTILDKENSVLQGISTEITPGDPAYGAKSGDTPLDPGNSALTDIQSGPNAGRHENTDAENVLKEIKAPKAGDPAYDSGGGLGEKLGLKTPKNTETGSGMDNREWVDRSYFKQFLKDTPDVAGNAAAPESPSKAFSGIVRLGAMAKDGDTMARRELQELASSESGLNSWYARWELGQLGAQ